ncbi:MAG: hypothetical protein JSS30_02615 [Verrucomicrobia bacterium]|nr:hypothetical protein [Verrucomicrobiota bacterium]
MVKKYITHALFGLGIAQMYLSPTQVFADECEAPCCEATIIPGEPLDPCLVSGGYPLPGNVSLCNGWDVYATGSFLYWTAYPPVSATIVRANSPNQTSPATTRNLQQKLVYKPGFRVGIGAALCGVVADVNYTRLHSKTTTHFSARANETISLTQGVTALQFANIKTEMTMDFDFVIGSLQKPFYIGKRIVFTPGFGIIGQWTKYGWDIDCSALNAPPTGFINVVHKSWAVGPGLTISTQALVTCGFRIVGNVILGSIYNRMTKDQSRLFFPNNPGAANNTFQKTAKSSNTWANAAMTEIGLGWASYLWCDRFFLDLTVAYHASYNTTSAIRGIQGINTQNFSLQGLVVSGRVDF